MDEEINEHEDEINDFDYDIYSKTPPRTKISRKIKERKHRDAGTFSTSKSQKIRTPKRITVNTAYEDMMEKSEDSDQGPKRTSKRSLKLLRGSERDLKLDISSAQQASIIQERKLSYETTNGAPQTPQPSYQIESCKRFKSLSCRTFPCAKLIRSKTEVLNNQQSSTEDDNLECPKSRVEFHKTLSLLVKMGFERNSQDRTPRRHLSKEEHLWQNELKDIIWLELQAFHADRTPTEEDYYLCAARDSAESLLNEIMNYRFRRHTKQYSTSNSDSGVEDDCEGCLSMLCLSCMEAQNDALKQIEDLMQRLEAAESLFPSGKAFAEIYPLYSSPEFIGRVKAISLWYNMTKHQRMKMVIIGKLLSVLENKSCQWPMICKVKCAPDSSPSDSNSSTSSECLNDTNYVDLYNITPIAMLVNNKCGSKTSPYRNYIEDVLKTRTLNKSLTFLDKLHQNLLWKVQSTLKKPIDEKGEIRISSDYSEEEELVRYGCWSPEAKDLNLPSYKACFLFLAVVPLEVIHEFLLMRLEQKPENPSPLSIRQLMRELKDGLKIAVFQKEKLLNYVESITSHSKNNDVDYIKEKFKEFDKTLLKIFSDYLSYLEHWALLQHEVFQKNLLEEEWQFSCGLIEQIPESAELLGNRFCYILSEILKSIGENLLKRIDEFSQCTSKEDDTFKHNLFGVCRKLQSLFNEQREMSIKTLAFCKTVFRYKFENSRSFKKMLQEAIITFKCVIPKAIERVQTICDQNNFISFDEAEKTSMISRTREISMQAFKFGFEFYREVSDNAPSENREKLVRSMIQFANLWMKFVTERCERGRGMRPRWAYQGLEFLLTVCEPKNTRYLKDEEFEELKKNMDGCISHVIGTTAPSTPDSGFYSASPRTSLEHIRSRSRGSSPSPRPAYKSQRSNNRKTSTDQTSPLSDINDSLLYTYRKESNNLPDPIVKIKLPPSHSERWEEAIELLEHDVDEQLMKQNLIGRVVSCSGTNKKQFLKRYVNFTWQRGIKIGQGRFGKVYTAVNNNTGEMMAVKEIVVQHNDLNAIKHMAEEVKILEGIVHGHILKYYGVEVHKDEMLIFMEYCAEGTLESLVAASEKGLPELLVRRYTFQLVSGVACLHDHGIVHRDIKTANIFLTAEGNCLKIGDFGCAIKIKSHTTMPGELRGFVGTQAYMAPEVFTQNMSEGHGRAADIWSIGCVAVEMASGKRPWSQFDSNYQIMFKVGMGQSPEPPNDMIDEGLEFLDRCFQHNPRDRATAQELLDLNFVKVGEDLL